MLIKLKFHGDSDRLTIPCCFSDPIASVTRAIRELKICQGVSFQAQEREEIAFVIITDDFKFFDSNLNCVWKRESFNIYIGPDLVNTQPVQINWFKL